LTEEADVAIDRPEAVCDEYGRADSRRSATILRALVRGDRIERIAGSAVEHRPSMR